MQTKSTYHGKEINLTAGNTTITSTNFSVDKNGNIVAKSGTIGGFTLGVSTFTTIIKGLYNYNIYDVTNAASIYFDNISNTSITSTLYDIDNDNSVDIIDAQAILDIVNNKRTNNKQISGTFQINTADPKDFISIKNGNNLAVSIGVGGINTHMLTTQNIVCGVSSDLEANFGVKINGNTGVVYAKNFSNTSQIEIKKNIEELEDVVGILENSKIYKYNYKTEKDNDKKHIGFIIGKDYKTPDEIIEQSRKGIDLYSLSSINWKISQEIFKLVKELQSKVQKLEEK